MAFNGSGAFTVSINFTDDKDASIPPTSSRFDADFNEVATGLSTAICKDGQSTITGDISFSGHKITGLADATAVTDAVNLKVAQARTHSFAASSSGTATAITASTSPSFTGNPVAGMVLTFVASANSVDGGTTISWNGGTAKNILKQNVAVVTGDWVAGESVACVYTGAEWSLLSPWHHSDIPKDTWLVLWQATAPAGYTMKTDAYDYMLMLADGTNILGGAGGGSWTISGLTAASHTHSVVGNTGAPSASVNGQGPAGGFIAASDSHYHFVSFPSGASGTLGVSSDSAWRPLYTSVIFCQRQ